MSKTKHTTWSHHETMLINLRDWIKREINLLRNDIDKEVPDLSSSASKMLKSAEDMNMQLFDTIGSVILLAEKTSNKKANASSTKKEEHDDFEQLDV